MYIYSGEVILQAYSISFNVKNIKAYFAKLQQLIIHFKPSLIKPMPYMKTDGEL